MKIKRINKNESHYVETDEELEPNRYIKHGENNWTYFFGEDEQEFYDCEELESLFQEKLKENNDFKLQPLFDMVIVKPVESEATTPSGLILYPDASQEKPIEGVVVAVGTGFINDKGNREELYVKVGDKVLYGKFAGVETTIDETLYLIMREKEIFATVK